MFDWNQLPDVTARFIYRIPEAARAYTCGVDDLYM
jgi:hypothetical protein